MLSIQVITLITKRVVPPCDEKLQIEKVYYNKFNKKHKKTNVNVI